MKRHARRSGFTLIELLIVIAIILILSGILIPVAGHMREKARKDECLNNLRQWGVALVSYLDDRRGVFPVCGTSVDDDKAWFNQLPPYLGTDPLKDMPNTPHPGSGIKSVFLCTSEKEDPTLPKTGKFYYSSYAFNTWIDKGGVDNGKIRFSQLNLHHNPPISPSSFVVFSETSTPTTPGVNLGTLTKDAFRHAHSFNVCFADGHAENALQVAVWKEGLSENDNFGGLHWNPTQENRDGSNP